MMYGSNYQSMILEVSLHPPERSSTITTDACIERQ